MPRRRRWPFRHCPSPEATLGRCLCPIRVQEKTRRGLERAVEFDVISGIGSPVGQLPADGDGFFDRGQRGGDQVSPKGAMGWWERCGLAEFYCPGSAGCGSVNFAVMAGCSPLLCLRPGSAWLQGATGLTSTERTAYPQFRRLTTARVLRVFFTPDRRRGCLGAGADRDPGVAAGAANRPEVLPEDGAVLLTEGDPPGRHRPRAALHGAWP
jgi:hypothetical protein